MDSNPEVFQPDPKSRDAQELQQSQQQLHDFKKDWMISAVFDRAGTPIAKAAKWGTIAVAEVDLAQPFVGPYNLGDFRAMVPRHRP